MLKKDWKRDIIWGWFHGKCILCLGNASGLHEIIPRSNIPNNWDEWSNRVPLCSVCHDKVQQNPSVWRSKLEQQRDYLMQLYGIDYPLDSSKDTASISKGNGR